MFPYKNSSFDIGNHPRVLDDSHSKVRSYLKNNRLVFRSVNPVFLKILSGDSFIGNMFVVISKIKEQVRQITVTLAPRQPEDVAFAVLESIASTFTTRSFVTLNKVVGDLNSHFEL